MAIDVSKSVDIIETMENYLNKVRPEPEIRHLVDIGYEITNQSVILNEIRPGWNNPEEVMIHPYAKTTYVHSRGIWKIYWLRSDMKWYSYDPKPVVKRLQDFLKTIDEDKYGCFKG